MKFIGKKWAWLCIGALALSTGCSSKEETVAEITTTPEVNISDNVLEVDGLVTTDVEKEIYIEFPAIVEEIYVVEGQVVNTGDSLIRFNHQDYINHLSDQQKEIAIKQVKLNQYKNLIDPQEAKLSAIQDELKLKKGYEQNDNDPNILIQKAKLEVAEKELAWAQKQYDDAVALLAVGGTSQNEVDSLLNAIISRKEVRDSILNTMKEIRSSNQVAISNLESELSSLNMSIESTRQNNSYNIEGLQLEIELAQSQLAVAKEKLNKSYIKDNTVVATEQNMVICDIACSEGSYVGESTRTIMTAINQEDLKVMLEVPIEDVHKVAVGNEVELSIYNNEANMIKGHITRISEKAEEIDGDTIVKAEVLIDSGIELLKVDSKLTAEIYLQ